MTFPEILTCVAMVLPVTAAMERRHEELGKMQREFEKVVALVPDF